MVNLPQSHGAQVSPNQAQDQLFGSAKHIFEEEWLDWYKLWLSAALHQGGKPPTKSGQKDAEGDFASN